MKIAIITDGNNTLGMGHIYQSKTIADFLSEKTDNLADIFFITKSNELVRDILKSTGKKVYYFENDSFILDKLKVLKPNIVIFDKLDVSPALAKQVKTELITKLVIFTNLTKANDYADITVLADIGSNFKNIINVNPESGGKQYFGPKFWILRPEFYKLKSKIKKINERFSEIMLIFGGSDPSNISSQVLNELMQIDLAFNILLVLGSAFEHNDELNAVIDKNKGSKSTVNIVRNITNVGETMHKSDLVFASPGLSFFEALTVGTPVIGFHQNELQREVYAEILPTMGIEDIQKLPEIIQNKTFLYPEDPIVSAMEIGDGKDEIITEILN